MYWNISKQEHIKEHMIVWPAQTGEWKNFDRQTDGWTDYVIPTCQPSYVGDINMAYVGSYSSQAIGYTLNQKGTIHIMADLQIWIFEFW